MSEKVYNIRDYGARTCDALQTNAIQAAIDACFLSGGGRVVVPCGIFRTGGLRLRSNVELYLESGAILRGSRDPADYNGYLTDTVEPITEPVWDAPTGRSARPISTWNNAIIRALDAHDIAVTGEPGSYIDGADCYDPDGEEKFRGPHAINFWRCENISFSGYTIVDSANWAHAIFQSRNITTRNVKVYGGHDGFDVRTCDNVLVEDCVFHTGDDCIAGFDNNDVVIRRCSLNTSCSLFRFGGNNVLIEDCSGSAPGIYGHRCSLTPEQKAASFPTSPENSRHDTLNVFLYYCDFRAEIRRTPGEILMRRCTFEGPNRLFALNFDGKHQWCSNRSLASIKFEDCTFTGLRYPVHIYGDANEKLTFELENVNLSAAPEFADEPLINAVNHEAVRLKNVRIKGYNKPRMIAYTEGVFETVDSTPVEVVKPENDELVSVNRE